MYAAEYTVVIHGERLFTQNIHPQFQIIVHYCLQPKRNTVVFLLKLETLIQNMKNMANSLKFSSLSLVSSKSPCSLGRQWAIERPRRWHSCSQTAGWRCCPWCWKHTIGTACVCLKARRDGFPCVHSHLILLISTSITARGLCSWEKKSHDSGPSAELVSVISESPYLRLASTQHPSSLK